MVEERGYSQRARRIKWLGPGKAEGRNISSETKGHVILRVDGASDSREWELFAPDGTLVEGWHNLAVGRDHSGRYSLHVTFDQFTCVNSDGPPVEMPLTSLIAKHHEKLTLLRLNDEHIV